MNNQQKTIVAILCIFGFLLISNNVIWNIIVKEQKEIIQTQSKYLKDNFDKQNELFEKFKNEKVKIDTIERIQIKYKYKVYTQRDTVYIYYSKYEKDNKKLTNLVKQKYE